MSKFIPQNNIQEMLLARIEELQTRILELQKLEEQSWKKDLELLGLREAHLASVKKLKNQLAKQAAETAALYADEIEALQQSERHLIAENLRLRIESQGQTKHIEALSQTIRDLKTAAQKNSTEKNVDLVQGQTIPFQV